MAVYTTVSASISIALITAVAQLSHAPLVFPALGGTAFLVFSRPLNPAACPRNIVLGHLTGCLCGWGALLAAGVGSAEPSLEMPVEGVRVLAAGLSLGVTSGLLVVLALDHPPAAATALLVSLGFLRSPGDLFVVMLAVLLVVAQAVVMNRRAGFRYPLWRPARDWGALQERGNLPPGP